MDAHCRAAVGGALAQARLEGFDFVVDAGRFLGLLDVLGHGITLFRLKFREEKYSLFLKSDDLDDFILLV